MAWGRLALIEAAKLNTQTLAEVAEVFEYEKQARKVETKPEGEVTAQRLSDEPIKATTPAQRKRSSGRLVRITKIEPLEQDAEQSHDYLYDPQQQLKANDEIRGTYQFDAPRPLLTSAQLIPFLHNTLGLGQPGKKVDQRVLNRLVSKGQPIQKLPYKRVQRWSQQLQILVDTGDHLRPYRSDFEQIITLLKQVLGSHNVTALRLREAMQRRQKALCLEWPTQQGKDWHNWQLPAADVPVLILSDFGVMERTGNDSDLWWQIAKDLYAHSAPVISLSPVASSPLNRAACQRLSISPLSDAGSLPRHALRGFEQKGLTETELQSILILLSPLPIIDAGLLRKLRDEFKWGSSAVESQLWNHPDMQLGSLGIRPKPSLAKDYAKRFRREVSQQDAEKLWGVVEKHHEHAHQGLKQLEQIGQCVASESDNQHVRSYLKQLSASTAQSAKGSAQHNALVMQCKTFLASQPDDIWNGALNDVFYDLCAMAYESEIKAGEMPPMLGEYFRPERLKWLLDDEERQEYVSWSVRQLGVSGEICFEQVSTATEIASPVYRFEALKKIPPTLHMHDGTVRSVQDGLVCKADELGSVEVRTEREVLHFDVIQKPDWAEAIGRDRYGLYVDITLARKQQQRFRWIPAGEFMMGETKSASVFRMSDSQRRVTVPDGYWLADSTVTQAQWRAVMNRKPSKFKGDSRPVERVSLEDVQRFIKIVNNKQTHLRFELPNEANWEYACRAGTNTVFSFGNRISTEQVNFKGIYPYQHENTDLYRDDNGLYREETVPVKSLPANPWGLYEMHGNVSEYCLVHRGKRTSGESTLSEYLGASDYVLRGGSWGDDGAFVRSAVRTEYVSGLREGYYGFRLAFVNPDDKAESGSLRVEVVSTEKELAEKGSFGNYSEELDKSLKLLLNKANIEMAKGNYTLAEKHYRQVLNRQRAVDDEVGEGVTLNNLSVIQRKLGNIDGALSSLELALKISQKHGDEVNQFVTLGNISGIYFLQGHYLKAEAVLEEALQISRKAGDKKGEHRILCDIARLVGMGMGRLDDAMAYLELAKNIAVDLNELSLETEALSDLGRVSVARGDYSLALRYHSLELEKRRELKDKPGEGVALHHMSQVCQLQGNLVKAISYGEQSLSIKVRLGDKAGEGKVVISLASILMAQGKFEESLRFYHLSRKIMQELGDTAGEGAVLNSISQLYFAMNDFDSTHKFLDEAYQVTLKAGDDRERFNILKNYAELYLKQEKMSGAIEYFGRAGEVARKLGDNRLVKFIEAKLNEFIDKSS